MKQTQPYNPENRKPEKNQGGKMPGTTPEGDTFKASSPRLPAFFLCCAALLLLCGGLLAYAKVRLALAEIRTEEDRLAGIFVTENHIPSAAPLVDFNVHGEIVIKEQEPVKIYGMIGGDNSQKPVVFPELEGFGIYNLMLPDSSSQVSSGHYICDDAFTDLHFTVSDSEEHAEASLYTRTGRFCRYYFNPVYQQEDGRLYLLPGSGISSDSLAAGAEWSQSLAQSRSESFNGTEETSGYRFTVKIVSADAPSGAELILMGQDNHALRILSDAELDLLFQQDMPRLEIPADVSYLVLRQHKSGGGGFLHTLYDRGAESLEYMVAADDSYLHPRSLPLIWQ